MRKLGTLCSGDRSMGMSGLRGLPLPSHHGYKQSTPCVWVVCGDRGASVKLALVT